MGVDRNDYIMHHKGRLVTRTTPALAGEPFVVKADCQEELIRRCSFAEPLFRASASDVERMRSLPLGARLGMPGADLAAASDYYWVEAYLNLSDRNAACRVTAHPSVKYIAVAPQDISTSDLSRISCGYDIDHPRFEEVFELTFASAVLSLHKWGRHWKTAELQLSIARALYIISPVPNGALRYQIDGLSLFEDHDKDLLERTTELLEERLVGFPKKEKLH